VAQEMQALGVGAAVLVARGIDNSTTSPDLLAYRRAAGRRLALHWKNRSISAHPAIQEYHRLHQSFEVAGESPAPERMILYVRRNRDFPATGSIVDCYNIVSARTLLSVGAHDLDLLSLPITLRRTMKHDVFQPLGSQESKQVDAGFGYADPAGNLICRLDVL